MNEYLKENSSGGEMMKFMKKLFPNCNSITGNGLRQTLKEIKRIIPIDIREVPSGTKVFDWTIPKEWNIKDAYVKDSTGKKIIDFKKSNLHVINYCVPINQKMSLEKLKEHLHTMEEHPDWLPYLTSYYKEEWGFTMAYNQYKKLKPGNYQVMIDSELKNGSLSYGEFYLKGKVKDEILLSTYICHPSLCNDNLSGVALLTYLARELKKIDLMYSYRFLFIPETIGAITWLSQNEKKVNNIKYGLVVSCVGDKGDYSTYKKTRAGNSILDKAAEKVLIDSGEPYKMLDFFPVGSDERQYSSPGFKLEVGSLMRTAYGRFPEYHTSADNLSMISPKTLANSLKKYLSIIYVLENNGTYINQNPKCEPQLGKRGLYRMIGSQRKDGINEKAMLWVLNFCDGNNSLLDIAVRSDLSFEQIKQAAGALLSKGLLKLKN